MLDIFKELAFLFKNNGFDLFLVGGSVRDYLLKGHFDDYDLATNASIDDVKKFLKIKSEYNKMGSGKFIFCNTLFDITSMRKENNYIDYRHPSLLEKVNSPYEEYSRRDFTINALYMDENEKIYDYSGGINDLNNKIIRCIGELNIRLKEDPLRIIRALRFASDLDFTIDHSLKEAILNNKKLLIHLRKEKINDEFKKVKNIEKMNLLLNNYGIDKIIPIKINSSIEKNISYIEYTNNFIDLLNGIILNNSFINIIKINNKKEIEDMKNNITIYNNYVGSTLNYKKILNMYENKMYIILFEVNKKELIDMNDNIAYIINKNNIDNEVKFAFNGNIFFYDKLVIKDENYYNIKNKKLRNKMYYEYFINMLKD